MGVDIIELNIGIEETFGFELEIEFWRNAKTFGDVLDEVVQRFKQNDNSQQNQSEDHFQETRQETRKELREELEKIVPNLRDFDERHKLTRIVPFWCQRRFWESLRERFPMLPPLDAYRNRQMFNILCFEPIPFFTGIIFWTLSNTIETPFLSYPFAVLGIAGFVGFVAVFPLALRTFFLLPCKRIGDLVSMIADKQHRFEKLHQGDNVEFESALRDVFCHALGIKPEKVTRDATLIKDLGIS